MSLYLKYRPVGLESIIGNDDLIESLTRMLGKKDHPHSYMLSGPTGCGKTTIARIMANMLNCVGNDYREINAADFRGIDSVRELIRQTSFSPLEGKSRVWVIDECHKMTGDAQNALLKVLEDTPHHVYFILCTTDPQKLIATVKNRCSQYVVKLLNDRQMFNLLRSVVKAEGEALTKPVYEQIIQDSQGHPRQALQILEQALSVEPEQRLEMAKRSAAEQSESIQLCQALIAGGTGWKKVSTILTGLKDQDPESIRRHVMGYASAVLLKSDNPRAGLVLEEFLEPFYNTGFPGLVYACYAVIKS